MIDLIDNYYSSNDTYNNSNSTDIDSQKISKNAISSVLPLILKNDLTERQRSCLKLKYVNRRRNNEKRKYYK